MASFVYQHGETVELMLEAVSADSADISAVSSVSAVLKKAIQGKPPPPSVASVATFTVTGVDAHGDVGPGWLLMISAADCEELEPGTYVTNARLTFSNGFVDKTESLVIEIERAT